MPGDDIRDALEMLEHHAQGAFHPSPVGNRVVVSCASEIDTELLLVQFKNARKLDEVRR